VRQLGTKLVLGLRAQRIRAPPPRPIQIQSSGGRSVHRERQAREARVADSASCYLLLARHDKGACAGRRGRQTW
jgi:hypothetical protein